MRVAPTAFLLLLALSFHPALGAEPSGSPVIDRTVRCTTGIQAGVRELYIDAQAGFRSPEKPSAWKWLPHVDVTTSGTQRGEFMLGGISAGSPLETSPGGGGLSLGLRRCKAVRASVPLTARGLMRQSVGQLGDQFECVVPRSLLLRVRGEFQSEATLLRNAFGYLSSNGVARSASLAIRTQSGKPLLYATAHESGAVRLFTGRGCVAE